MEQMWQSGKSDRRDNEGLLAYIERQPALTLEHIPFYINGIRGVPERIPQMDEFKLNGMSVSKRHYEIISAVLMNVLIMDE